MSETVQRKTDALTAWQLTDMAAMGTCIDELEVSLPEWRGSMNKSESGAWVLQFNADNPSRAIFASVGDWLVIDLGQLMHFPADGFASYYEATEA